MIGAALDAGLRANGHHVIWQRSGTSGLVEARESGADLVFLDLGLPDRDGLDICRELRATLPSAVIVILTARSGEMDIVSGLESGADDYLLKPFNMVEVLARVRAHLRRSVNIELSNDAGPPVVVGSLTVDRGARRVVVGGIDVALRAREFDLLERLASSAGSAISREELMSQVWDEHWFGSTKTLDVHMVSLRRKLAEVAEVAGPSAVGTLPTITTLRGFGYRLESGIADSQS